MTLDSHWPNIATESSQKHMTHCHWIRQTEITTLKVILERPHKCRLVELFLEQVQDLSGPNTATWGTTKHDRPTFSKDRSDIAL